MKTEHAFSTNVSGKTKVNGMITIPPELVFAKEHVNKD